MNLMTKFLTAIGLRSKCCGSKIEAWHAGKNYCTGCEKWLYKNVSAEAVESLKAATSHPVLRLKRLK